MTTTNHPAPPKDKYLTLHEAMMRDTEVTDEDITSELRSLGSILEPVSKGQRRELDMIAAMRPGVRKLSRRKKKAQRRGK